ncbi:uncharacterized protein DEA37_0010843 [Paragonimus westermani]|uniref:cGMP-dependent protein kinase interacting domain-containing protein n=1 Tax=Paragonimus westermani TaxID=34504 RepID=A0A5J4P0X8_9TREM|nr:uncharacterized protein DEA37_0010843 [Paragonimus westermani]
MLYGGPLGTYLSGLSSSSTSTPLSSTSSTYAPSQYSNPGYLRGGIWRSNSRYRPNTTVNSSISSTPITSNSVTNSPSLSSYYTPQLRRKYCVTETESTRPTNTVTTSRYTTSRSQPHSPLSQVASSSGVITTTAQSGTGNSGSNLFHYSRWSPHKTNTNNPGYAGTTLGTSSSWNSDLNMVTNSPNDYKRLYEAEKVATDELREEVAAAQKETRELHEQISAAIRSRRSSNAEKRTLEKVRAESEKLRAEHRALVRVVSRLNREQ